MSLPESKMPKLIKGDGESRVMLIGFESEPIDNDNDPITWTFNVAPEEDASTESLLEHAAYVTKVAYFIEMVLGKDHSIEVKTDFYWKDGDLLINVDIPRTSLILKNIEWN